MNSSQNLILEKYFNILKRRNRSNIHEILEIASLYENFRDCVSWSGIEKFEEFSILTGKALSNISFDLMSMKEVTHLKEINSNLENDSLIFFLGHRGGLCNRLRAIASLNVIADILGCNFGFSWAETDSCRGGPLSNSGFANRVSPIIQRIVSSSGPTYLEDNPASAGYFFDLLKNTVIDLSWKEFNRLYIDKSSVLLDFLLEKTLQKNILEDFISENMVNKFTALHIRRTDFVPYFTEKFPNETLPSIDAYLNFARSQDSSEKIFVSTDDISVKEIFLSEFGSRALFFNFEFESSKFRQTSFNHALLDLAMLSRSTKLAITPRSSFSDYAASISKAQIVKI